MHTARDKSTQHIIKDYNKLLHPLIHKTINNNNSHNISNTENYTTRQILRKHAGQATHSSPTAASETDTNDQDHWKSPWNFTLSLCPLCTTMSLCPITICQPNMVASYLHQQQSKSRIMQSYAEQLTDRVHLLTQTSSLQRMVKAEKMIAAQLHNGTCTRNRHRYIAYIPKHSAISLAFILEIIQQSCSQISSIIRSTLSESRGFMHSHIVHTT